MLQEKREAVIWRDDHAIFELAKDGFVLSSREEGPDTQGRLGQFSAQESACQVWEARALLCVPAHAPDCITEAVCPY